jgi:hypothetical protein
MKHEAMSSALTIYDVSIGARRAATQEDIDRLSDFVTGITFVNMKIDEKRGIAETFDFRLAVFPNRMRDDGVFVAQDLPIEPYSGVKTFDGRECYPSIPQRGVRIGHQLPCAFAHEIVRRWNAALKS